MYLIVWSPNLATIGMDILLQHLVQFLCIYVYAWSPYRSDCIIHVSYHTNTFVTTQKLGHSMNMWLYFVVVVHINPQICFQK